MNKKFESMMYLYLNFKWYRENNLSESKIIEAIQYESEVAAQDLETSQNDFHLNQFKLESTF